MSPVPSGRAVRRWRYIVQISLRVLAFGLVLTAAKAGFEEIASFGQLSDLLRNLSGGYIHIFIVVGAPLLAAAAILMLEKRLIAFLAPLPTRGCPNCGYSLENLRSPICPECGSDIDTATPAN